MNNAAVYVLASEANTKVSNHFAVKEFRCHDKSEKYNTIVLIAPALVDMLEQIRVHFGVPVTINSAYRNEKYNGSVGGVSCSTHCRGMAADIVVQGIAPKAVYAFCCAKWPGTGGFGLYSNFVHVDCRTAPSRWISGAH